MDFDPTMPAGPLAPPEPPSIRGAGGMNLVDLPPGLSMPSSLTGTPQIYPYASARGNDFALPGTSHKNQISVSMTNSSPTPNAWPENAHGILKEYDRANNTQMVVTEDTPRQLPLRADMKQATTFDPQAKRGNLGHVARAVYKELREIRLGAHFSLASSPDDGQISASVKTGHDTEWKLKAKKDGAFVSFGMKF